MLLGAQPLVQLVGLYGELATDGILHVEDGRVEVGDGEGAHGVTVLIGVRVGKAARADVGDGAGAKGERGAGERALHQSQAF